MLGWSPLCGCIPLAPPLLGLSQGAFCLRRQLAWRRGRLVGMNLLFFRGHVMDLWLALGHA
jgi:hypothetical protein